MVARPSTSCHVYTAVQMVLAKLFASAARQETVEPCSPLRTVVGILVVVLQLLLLQHTHNNYIKLLFQLLLLLK